MVEGARLESVFRGNSNEGSNPSLSATLNSLLIKDLLKVYLKKCAGFCAEMSENPNESAFFKAPVQNGLCKVLPVCFDLRVL